MLYRVQYIPLKKINKDPEQEINAAQGTVHSLEENKQDPVQEINAVQGTVHSIEENKQRSCTGDQWRLFSH